MGHLDSQLFLQFVNLLKPQSLNFSISMIDVLTKMPIYMTVARRNRILKKSKKRTAF